MNERYKSYLESETWHEIRHKILVRDSGRCRVCNSERSIQVHHRCYPKVYGTEPLEDLICLCEVCHKLFHHIPNVKKLPKTPKLEHESNGILARAREKLRSHGVKVSGNVQHVTKRVCIFTGERYPRKGQRTRANCFSILKRFVENIPSPVLKPPVVEPPKVFKPVVKLRKKVESPLTWILGD